MSSKILLAHCLHAADRPPLGRIDGYRDQILGKLVEIGEIAKQTNADVAIFAGDLFHSKRPNFASHYLRTAIQEILRTYPCDVWLLLGNHDLGAATDQQGLLRQPIAGLEGGNVYIAAGDRVIQVPDAIIFFRPYDAARDTDPGYYKLTPQELMVAEKAPYVIVVGHGSVIPPGEDRPYPHVKFEDIDTTGIGVYYFGHLHEYLGVHIVGAIWFAGMGCIGRTSRTEANMTHEPRVVVIEKDGDLPTQFHERKLQVLPASEVFIEQIRTEEGVSDEIVDFADSLAKGLSLEQMPLDALSEGRGDIDPDVKAKVKHYLESAGL
jgi:DNA repair exonuclease SbcCD nuclease subunit